MGQREEGLGQGHVLGWRQQVGGDDGGAPDEILAGRSLGRAGVRVQQA